MSIEAEGVEVRFDGDEGDVIPLKFCQHIDDYLYLVPNATMPPDSILQVSIRYRGQHGEGGESFFHGEKKLRGKNYEGLFTQFQPTYAREAFPCIDQPEFKSVFKVGCDNGRTEREREGEKRAWEK